MGIENQPKFELSGTVASAIEQAKAQKEQEGFILTQEEEKRIIEGWGHDAGTFLPNNQISTKDILPTIDKDR